MNDTRPYGEHLQILQAKEVEELYAIPSFDLEDRMTYLSLSAAEYTLMQNFRGLSSRVYFVLQLGYFKAKHLFFIFDFRSQRIDVDFVLHKYFSQYTYQDLKPISKPTRLHQRQVICQFLGYQFFETYLFATILEQAAVFAKRHNHSVYLFRSLLHYFHNHRIILPAYSFVSSNCLQKKGQDKDKKERDCRGKKNKKNKVGKVIKVKKRFLLLWEK